jgi:hypothetical protein
MMITSNIWGGPEVRAVKAKLPNMRYFFNFFFWLKKVLSSELNPHSQSVLPIIHHVLEHLQRDFVNNFHDHSNHLVFPGKMLSF